jgi:hypothetical protein
MSVSCGDFAKNYDIVVCNKPCTSNKTREQYAQAVTILIRTGAETPA